MSLPRDDNIGKDRPSNDEEIENTQELWRNEHQTQSTSRWNNLIIDDKMRTDGAHNISEEPISTHEKTDSEINFNERSDTSRRRSLSRWREVAKSISGYDNLKNNLEDHMGFTELVMTEEDTDVLDFDSVSDGIRERLLTSLQMSRIKRGVSQSPNSSSSEMPDSIKLDINFTELESLRDQKLSSIADKREDEEDESSPNHHLMMNIFSPPMIEQFLLTDRNYPEAEDIELELIDTIEFSLKGEANDLTVHSKSMPLSHLKSLLNEHAKEMQNMNRKRRRKGHDEAHSAVPLGSPGSLAGMDESGRKLYRARIEINSYPLETRMLISNKQSLENLRERLNLYAISQEGVMAQGHQYFINIDGYSKETCELAVNEITSIMDAQVEDYAQCVDLHDLMQLLLAMGTNSPPVAMTARHCVLLGLYPVQCVITADKLILIEPKSLANSKNLILETIADEIAKVLRHLIISKAKLRKILTNSDYKSQLEEKNHRRKVNFDQLCYEAVFLTVWKIHINAMVSVQNRALVCHKVYNARAYVSLEDQKQMYMVKMQAKKLRDTLKSMSSEFEGILAKDVAMAFMNLNSLKADDSIYRMTVDRKKTLSTFDDRVTAASHDIELILYAHYLRYVKLEKEAERVIDMLRNVEEWQTLQSLNTQTKVLVANTYMTVLGCTIAFGGAVTGAFGMNLDNVYVDWPDYTFLVVCGVTLLLIAVGTKVTIDVLQGYGVIPRQTSL